MAFKPPPLFVDTWGWLALEDHKEPRHHQSVAIRRAQTDDGGRLVTTDYVLDETFTRLFARRPFPEAERFSDRIFQTEHAGLLSIEPITRQRFEDAFRLRLRYRDKPRISFTDLTSFVVMKELGIRQVLTADAHFAKAHLGFQLLP